MTKISHGLLCLLVLLACGLIPLTAAAGPITFTESFMAGGTANGMPFNGNVTFTFTTDTSLITGGPGQAETPRGVAGIMIQGIGSGMFSDSLDVFVNGNVAGFSDPPFPGDIVDLSNPAFATYDLRSPIGPLVCTFFYVQPRGIGTTLGTVFFTSESGNPTFTATTSSTPEPSSIALFGSGVLGLAGVIRRKLST